MTSVNFNVIEMVVSLFLITIAVAVAAFWENLSDWLSSRKVKNDRSEGGTA
ncbi:MAG: hypothetical protein QM780_00230 [Hyphomicrobium sp.]|uniref:hypothetical protein n=1 Tax=Hyphomicrobium sp. TaxID=82 RepID=UPI0039E43BAD